MYMTVREAAQAMRCSDTTVRRMVNSGLLEYIEVGVGDRKSIRVKLPPPKVKEDLGIAGRREYVGSILRQRLR